MNCLDCLGRTNIVQRFIALEVSSLGCLWGKSGSLGELSSDRSHDEDVEGEHLERFPW